MLTMSYLWKCVLLWCGGLLIFPEIVTSLSTCLQSGDCTSGFYCHTGSGLCLSCDKCSDARGNLQLCEKECFIATHTTKQDVIIGDPSTSSKRMIVVIVSTTVVTAILVAGIVAVICLRRRCKDKLGIGIPETGDERMRTTPPTLPPIPECASPDESVNQRSLLLPIYAES